METMKDKLVKLALEWEDKFGVAPRITASISEYDAAMVTGMTEDEYSQEMQDKTAVGEGYDFEYNKLKYQVKGSRPSKKREKEHPKDPVTKVGKAAIEYKEVNLGINLYGYCMTKNLNLRELGNGILMIIKEKLHL